MMATRDCVVRGQKQHNNTLGHLWELWVKNQSSHENQRKQPQNMQRWTEH